MSNRAGRRSQPGSREAGRIILGSALALIMVGGGAMRCDADGFIHQQACCGHCHPDDHHWSGQRGSFDDLSADCALRQHARDRAQSDDGIPATDVTAARWVLSACHISRRHRTSHGVPRKNPCGRNSRKRSRNQGGGRGAIEQTPRVQVCTSGLRGAATVNSAFEVTTDHVCFPYGGARWMFGAGYPGRRLDHQLQEPLHMPSLPMLTIEAFRETATEYADGLAETPFPSLYGATDGKAVGTAVEAGFKKFLQERFDLEVGNAANGLDFPSLNLDLKVTSLKQPQSSCPFREATQKIYGLGYNLLVIVYVKTDDVAQQVAYLDIKHVIYIDKLRTGDFNLTRQIRKLVEEVEHAPGGRDALVEELDALLQDKNVPLDHVSRRTLAERLTEEVPHQGFLTISNALQWRLQYSRAIGVAREAQAGEEVTELRA